MRGPQRRKRNITGHTLHLMKRRAGRKKRRWRATRKKAKKTKRNMRRITRRNRRKGNMNHLPLLPPAPVTPQIMTEMLLCLEMQQTYFLQTLCKYGHLILSHKRIGCTVHWRLEVYTYTAKEHILIIMFLLTLFLCLYRLFRKKNMVVVIHFHILSIVFLFVLFVFLLLLTCFSNCTLSKNFGKSNAYAKLESYSKMLVDWE